MKACPIMYSYVQVNGMKSRPFKVIQGVRQGGVTSTWYYLLYIDDLLRELDSLEGGCTIGSLRTSNPTLAFLYSRLTKTGAEKGLKVADNHANRWHYTHHPAKCKLLVFSLVRTPSNATVKLGTSTISQAESVSHVGIEIHKSFKSSAAINARIAKGRSSLFSILSIDRETSLLNPITIASLFEKVCLPSVLYGSELWHNMTAEVREIYEACRKINSKVTDANQNRYGPWYARVVAHERQSGAKKNSCSCKNSVQCHLIPSHGKYSTFDLTYMF